MDVERVRVVVAGRIAQLDRAGRWVELDADLLLRREIGRREIGRLDVTKPKRKIQKSIKIDKMEEN
jgi:hypothetical protein